MTFVDKEKKNAGKMQHLLELCVESRPVRMVLGKFTVHVLIHHIARDLTSIQGHATTFVAPFNPQGKGFRSAFRRNLNSAIISAQLCMPDSSQH